MVSYTDDDGTAESVVGQVSSEGWGDSHTMSSERFYSFSVVLNDGRVLSGGGSLTSRSTEIYDPATETWSAGPDTQIERYMSNGTLLQDGRFLVVGGAVTASKSTAEIFDPTTNSWSATAAMPVSVAFALGGANLLPDGRVLVTNMALDYSRSYIYDPVADSWPPPPT